jgi:hypothetical protein
VHDGLQWSVYYFPRAFKDSRADHSLIYLKLRDLISHEAAARLADIMEK